MQALIARQQGTGGGLAAICAAPIALGRAGILKGKCATSYPGFEAELTGARLREEPVVKDGNVFTSRGPGTAMQLAFALVEELCSPATASELREKMLVAD